MLQKRRRREYRQVRRAAFTRPEPGFSLYEGRTRGKRARYTFEEDDDDDLDSDDTSYRRSTRNSARETPIESGPEYTASGRQIKKPRTGGYGESLLSNAISTDELAPDYSDARGGGSEDSEPVRSGGRATRAAANGGAGGRTRNHIEGYNKIDAMSEEEESVDEWNSGKEDEVEDAMPPDDDDELEDSEEDEKDEENKREDEPQSLVLKLKLSPSAPKPAAPHVSSAYPTPASA